MKTEEIKALGLDKIRYKFTASENWIEKIHLIEKDGQLVDGERQSFNRLKNPLVGELEQWLSIPGNEIEVFETAEEKILREAKELEDLKSNLKAERNRRLVQADKWELPTVLQRFGITIDQVLNYKLELIAIDETHTTREQLENPTWPVKLIEQDLI